LTERDIIVVVNGRFHGFDLARELHKKGRLQKLITSYPSSVAIEYGIPRAYISTLLPFEVLKRIFLKFPSKYRRFLLLLQKILFDLYVSLTIPMTARIVVGWSSSSLFTFRRLRKHNPKCTLILERGSTHIQYQNLLLGKIYQELNHHFYSDPGLIIERELIEYELADRIFLPTEFCKNTFIDYDVPDNKVHVVPYGVNFGEFSPKIEARNTSDSTFTIINVGGLKFRKGSHVLMKALEILNADNVNFNFIHAGKVDPEMADKCYNKSNAKYMGHIPQRQLVKIYNQASLFVLPSFEEGLAMVQLQALACHLPIITTENAGGKELSNYDNVTIIKDITPRILANQIKDLMDGTICKISPSRCIARSDWSWEAYATRFLSASDDNY